MTCKHNMLWVCCWQLQSLGLTNSEYHRWVAATSNTDISRRVIYSASVGNLDLQTWKMVSWHTGHHKCDCDQTSCSTRTRNAEACYRNTC